MNALADVRHGNPVELEPTLAFHNMGVCLCLFESTRFGLVEKGKPTGNHPFWGSYLDIGP